MSRNIAVFNRRKDEAVIGIALCIVLAAIAVAIVYMSPNLTVPKPIEPYIALGAVVLALVFLIALIYSIVILADTGPKLSVDAQGIMDHRSIAGPRRIFWGDIHSMDSNVIKVNNTITQAQLILYVVSDKREVQEVIVDLAGLDSDPVTVQGLIKRTWIQFMHQIGEEKQPD